MWKNPELVAFFVFNPTLQTNEVNGHDKVLCFYPEDVDEDLQDSYVGMAQAIGGFTEHFTSTPNYHKKAIHCKDCLHATVRVEPDIWIGLVVSHASMCAFDIC